MPLDTDLMIMATGQASRNGTKKCNHADNAEQFFDSIADETARVESEIIQAVFADPTRAALIDGNWFFHRENQIILRVLNNMVSEGVPNGKKTGELIDRMQQTAIAGANVWNEETALQQVEQIVVGSLIEKDSGSFAYSLKKLKELANRRELLELADDMHQGLAAGKTSDEIRELLQDAIDRQQRSTEQQRAFKILNSAELDSADLELTYIVKGWIVEGQPGEFGAGFKQLKSTIAVELGVAVSSGTPFLGKFDVIKRKRVLIMSAESGMTTLRAKARCCCNAREGLKLADLKDWLLWCDDVPQLSNVKHLSELAAMIKELGVEFLILDPTYLVINGENMSNLSDQGAQLREFGMLCQRLGVTLFLIHHTKKNHPPGEPLELVDIQGAGHAEFVRQWILINRRETYDKTTGIHKLWINYGGSAGHCGLIGCDIFEGVYRPDADWRKWEVTINDPDEVRRVKSEQQAEAKQTARATKAAADCTAAIDAIQSAFSANQNTWLPESNLADAAGIPRNNKAFKSALGECIRTGKVETDPTMKGANGHKCQHYRWKFKDEK